MNGLMVPRLETGILGHGAYVPRHRLDTRAIAEHWNLPGKPPGRAKSFAGADEDTITMAIEAARNAVARAEVAPARLRAIWVGSESSPYAVKPCATVVAEALGAGPHLLAADLKFGAKSGSEALQAALALVGSGMGSYALCAGMDASRGKPGDELEYTAAAGGAAFIAGPASEAAAVLEGSLSYVTDTPDYFRRAYSPFAEHGRRFAAEAGYLDHTVQAARLVLAALDLEPADIDHVVFHQPNGRLTRQVAERLGCTAAQLAAGLVVDHIGNTYAGSALLGLSAVLDVARPGQRILCVTYGSGAGSDAFLLRTTDRIVAIQARPVATCLDYLERADPTRSYVDYLRATEAVRS
jgi:hydroxymethylglutaryl-CoA synthase